MTFLTIDQDKCKNNGFCAMDCSVGIIKLDMEGKGFPVVAAEMEVFD